MTISAIGPYQFISLSAPPEPPKPDLELVTRQGVNGVAVWDTGHRGHPFVVRSKVDVSSVQDAWDLYNVYLGEIGSVQPVWWGNVMTWATNGAQYLVRDVKHPPLIIALGGRSGGLSISAGAWLEVDWELVAITT